MSDTDENCVKRSVNGSRSGSAVFHSPPDLISQGVGVKPVQGPTTGAPSKPRGGPSLGRKDSNKSCSVTYRS